MTKLGKKVGLKSNNKNNKPKVNDNLKAGKFKAPKVPSDSSEDDEESTDESSSENEIDSKTKKTATNINNSDNSDDSSESESILNNKKRIKGSSDSENSEDSSDDSSESESEPKLADSKVSADVKNDKEESGDSSDSESDDSSDSGSDDSESDDEDLSSDKKSKKTIINSKKESSDEESEEDDEDNEEEEESDEDNNKKSKSKEKTEASDIKSTSQVVKRKINEEFSNSIKKPKIESDCKTVFVGDLSFEVDDYMLQEEMKEAGYVIKARIMYDKFTKKSKGFAYVDFATPQEAQNALELSGKKINGKAIVVRLDEKTSKTPYQKPGGSGFNKNLSEPSDTVFVGNLSFKADENQLDKLFNKFGTIVSIRLPTHQDTGGLKGFGYVQFSDINAAQKAMDLQGTVLAGRSIRLDYADTKQKNNNSFGNAGRGSSNRGKFGGSFGRGNGRNFGGNNRNNNVNSFSPASANRGAIVPGGGKKIVFDE